MRPTSAINMSQPLTYPIGASLTLADLAGEVHPLLHKLSRRFRGRVRAAAACLPDGSAAGGLASLNAASRATGLLRGQVRRLGFPTRPLSHFFNAINTEP